MIIRHFDYVLRAIVEVKRDSSSGITNAISLQMSKFSGAEDLTHGRSEERFPGISGEIRVRMSVNVNVDSRAVPAKGLHCGRVGEERCQTADS